MDRDRKKHQTQPDGSAAKNTRPQVHFEALLEAWEPSPRLNEIVGEGLSKRDKRRLVAVIQQYQFDQNTPDESIARFRRLATKEMKTIAPGLAPEQIEQLWTVPPQELFSQKAV